MQLVSKGGLGARIAPVSASLASARRDPRLARAAAPPAAPAPPAAAPSPAAPASAAAPIAANVFDIKPLGKRRNVLSYDVAPAPRRRDPRLDKRERRDKTRRAPARPAPAERERKRPDKQRKLDDAAKDTDSYIDKLIGADPKKINKLPPIPKKANRDEPEDKEAVSPVSPAKRPKEDGRADRKKRRDVGAGAKDGSDGSSPDKRPAAAEREPRRPKAKEERGAEPEVVAFKELRNYHKERYMRRNKEKSESPDATPAAPSKLSLSVCAPRPPDLVVSDARSTCCGQIKCFSTAGVFILTLRRTCTLTFKHHLGTLLLRTNSKVNATRVRSLYLFRTSFAL